MNPSGDKLAVAIISEGKLGIVSFDNSTGSIPYLFEIDFDSAVYGCEFSPDGSKFYMTNLNRVMQVDMNAGSPSDILNSLTSIYEFSYSDIGAMQTGPDGRIYISPDASDFLVRFISLMKLVLIVVLNLTPFTLMAVSRD